MHFSTIVQTKTSLVVNPRNNTGKPGPPAFLVVVFITVNAMLEKIV
jgi:hypothetical protein